MERHNKLATISNSDKPGNIDKKCSKQKKCDWQTQCLGTILAQNCTIIFVTNDLLSFCGYSEQELIGKNLNILLSAPNTCNTALLAWNPLANVGTFKKLSMFIKKGTVIDVGLQVISRKLLDYQVTELVFYREYDKCPGNWDKKECFTCYMAMADLLPYPVLLILNNKIIRANQLACDFLGYHSTKQLTNTSISNFFGETYLQKIEIFLRNRSLVQVYKSQLITAAKKTVPFESVLQLLPFKNRTYLQIAIHPVSDLLAGVENYSPQVPCEKLTPIKKIEMMLGDLVQYLVIEVTGASLEKDREKLAASIKYDLHKMLREIYRCTKGTSVRQLTTREREILKLIQQNKKSLEIAKLLGISFDTVSYHRKNIRKRLGLQKGHLTSKSELDIL